MAVVAGNEILKRHQVTNDAADAANREKSLRFKLNNLFEI